MASHRVRLFAGLKERFGAERVEVELSDSATVADLRAALCALNSAAEPLIRRAVFATDQDYVPDSLALRGLDELSCIPPVSGG